MSQMTARHPAIAAAALIGTWLAGCASEPSAGPAPTPTTNGGARKQTAFGEARAACRMLGQFASAAEQQSEPAGSAKVSVPFPDGSDLDTGTVLAYEENRLFTYVVVARSLEGGPARGDRSSGPAPELIRRILHLKPATFVIDDQVSVPAAARQVGWRLAAGREPEVSGRRVRLAGESGELIVEGLLPHGARVAVERDGPSGFRAEESAPAGHGGARLLHLLQIRNADRDRGAPVAELEEAGDDVKLTIRAGEAIHRLELPAGRLGPGHIAMTEAGDRVVLGRRVLPSGVLPFGPIGARLIRRWDEEYHDGRLPPWETGRVCSELERVIQRGEFRPGRALDLGCGTGMNAIDLAGRGFDVTAVDISPTALALAEERARQAGVPVRWVLADVTKLPDLGTFDLLLDRGCYHNVREQDLAGYVAAVRRCSRPGTQFHLMAGNANEVPPYGPPRVSEADLRRELGSLFEFEWLRESHFDPPRGQPGPAPLAWSVLLRRKAGP